MPTVAELGTRVQSIVNELISLQAKITDSYQAYIHPTNEDNISMELDYKAKAEMYDRLFQEKEGSLQQSLGPRGRAQTLQEYILTFFFVAFAIFALGVTLMTTTSTGMVAKGVQMFMLMFVISVFSGLFIIRFG